MKIKPIWKVLPTFLQNFPHKNNHVYSNFFLIEKCQTLCDTCYLADWKLINPTSFLQVQQVYEHG